MKSLQDLERRLSGVNEREENVIYNWIKQGILPLRIFREYITSRVERVKEEGVDNGSE